LVAKSHGKCFQYAFIHRDRYISSGQSSLAASTSRSAYAPPSAPNAGSSANTGAAGMSPELEQTLSLLSGHKSVLGYLLITRSSSRSSKDKDAAPAPVSIIRQSGVIFDGEQGRKYAGAIAKMVESVQKGLEEVSTGDEVVSISFISMVYCQFTRYRMMYGSCESGPRDTR
jgi:hypothetical protein